MAVFAIGSDRGTAGGYGGSSPRGLLAHVKDALRSAGYDLAFS